MRVNGPTTPAIQPSNNAPAAKSQLPLASGPWNFCLTEFPGPDSLGLHTQSVLDGLPPVTLESTAALAQRHVELPGPLSGEA
jgi:hypothetical protein